MLSALRNCVAPSLSACILSPSIILNENRVNSVMSHMFLHIGILRLSSSSSDNAIKQGKPSRPTAPNEAVKFWDESAFAICDSYRRKSQSSQSSQPSSGKQKTEEKPSAAKEKEKKSSCSALNQVPPPPPPVAAPVTAEVTTPIDNLEKYAGGSKCPLEPYNQWQPRPKRLNDLDIAYGIPSVDENCFTVCYAYKKKLHEVENGVEPQPVESSKSPVSEPVREAPKVKKCFKAMLPPAPVCKFTRRFRAKPGNRRLSHTAARYVLKVEEVPESPVEDMFTPKLQEYTNCFNDFVERQLGLDDIFVYTDAVKQNCTFHQDEQQQLEIIKLKN